jgi:uncharacterized protein
MPTESFLRRHALPIYFIAAYSITWGGILLVASTFGFDPSAIQLAHGMLMYLAMLLGPSLASLGLTALLDGKAGLRALFARMRPVRLERRWYSLMLATPVLAGLVLMALGLLVSPAYLPVLSLSRLAMGVVIGGLAGLFEETGWTGFALPRLQARYSPLASGAILGLLWAVWHGMADWWGNSATFDGYWLLNFVIYWILPLTAYRILMSWMYSNTKSLFAAQVMHMAYTGTLVAISPSLPVQQALVWEVLFAAGLWVLVGRLWLNLRAVARQTTPNKIV